MKIVPPRNEELVAPVVTNILNARLILLNLGSPNVHISL